MILLGLLVLMNSCDRPICKNTNKILAKFSPETKEYKDELVKQLAIVDHNKLSYWLESYQEIGAARFVQVNIQGDGLCAKMPLRITSSTKGIEEILKSKVESYHGAELKNLLFEIVKDSLSTEFVFQEISGIVD